MLSAYPELFEIFRVNPLSVGEIGLLRTKFAINDHTPTLVRKQQRRQQ